MPAPGGGARVSSCRQKEHNSWVSRTRPDLHRAVCQCCIPGPRELPLTPCDPPSDPGRAELPAPFPSCTAFSQVCRNTNGCSYNRGPPPAISVSQAGSCCLLPDPDRVSRKRFSASEFSPGPGCSWVGGRWQPPLCQPLEPAQSPHLPRGHPQSHPGSAAGSSRGRPSGGAPGWGLVGRAWATASTNRGQRTPLWPQRARYEGHARPVCKWEAHVS